MKSYVSEEYLMNHLTPPSIVNINNQQARSQAPLSNSPSCSKEGNGCLHCRGGMLQQGLTDANRTLYLGAVFQPCPNPVFIHIPNIRNDYVISDLTLYSIPLY